MTEKTSIIVIEGNPTRAAEILDGLRQGGWADVTVVVDVKTLGEKMARHEPDIVLIDLANPNRDMLENLSAMSGASCRPVAMFVDRTDKEMTEAAMRAGLSAYVVDGLSRDRIRPVLETAIARFRMTSQLRAERDAAKQALESRKNVDRAKGLLMQARGIGEDDAYRLLRKTAMDQGRKVNDVAQALITASELLG